MIPLSVPHLAGNEWQYVQECLDTNWVSSVGAYVDRFEQAVAAYTGAKYAVACVNGTAALHVALRLVGVQQGDYVIVPNLTFIASVNAIVYEKARPILMDVQEDTWQMDLDLLETFLSKQTKWDAVRQVRVLTADGRPIRAVMPVHVLGNMCDMDRLMALAEKFSLKVVEDSTEALGSYFKGQHAGTFGTFGAFSFNGNKIITTGGGGMIVTDDAALAHLAKHLTTQAKSDSFEYIHDEVGYNYRLVNVLAALGVAQMEQLPDIRVRKQQIAQFYYDHLAGVGDIQFQTIPEEVSPNQWLFTIRTASQRALLTALNAQKIQARPFWVPMNELEMFKADLYIQTGNQAHRLYETCLSIPCSASITDAQLAQVVQAIQQCF